MKVCLVNRPRDYFKLIGELADEISVQNSSRDFDFIHFFTNKLSELEENLPVMKHQIKKDGCIWVSWYKKASGKSSELSDQIVRDTALAIGLVDVKVCSISDDWSGLKLVFRIKDRS